MNIEAKENPRVSTRPKDPERQEDKSTIRIDIPEGLEPEVWSKCCIHRVPRKLRKVNERAYTPQLLSIGPFHHGRPELLGMEPHKKRYYDEFRRRTGRTHSDLTKFARSRRHETLHSYAGTVGFSEDAFLAIVLVDACFVVELLLRNSEGRSEEDYILRTPWLRRDVTLDLLLLENQIPFPFLDQLCAGAVEDLSEGTTVPLLRPARGISELAREFFSYTRHLEDSEATGVRHFTDLVRRGLLPAEEPLPSLDNARPLYSATRLEAAGLGLAVAKSPRLAEMELAEGWLWTELRIPELTVGDDTECVVRNVMALEQCVYPYEAHVCSYILFLDKLVDTAEDVELLTERRVVQNLLGSGEAVAGVINGLCDQIVATSSCYCGVAERLNGYCESLGNRTRATIIRVYFKDCWTASTALFGFFVLLFSVSATIKALFF